VEEVVSGSGKEPIELWRRWSNVREQNERQIRSGGSEAQREAP